MVKGIVVEVEKLTHRTNIYYHVYDSSNAWEWYTEKNVPDSIIQYINKHKPCKTWENIYPDIKTTIESIVYKF